MESGRLGDRWATNGGLSGPSRGTPERPGSSSFGPRPADGSVFLRWARPALIPADLEAEERDARGARRGRHDGELGGVRAGGERRRAGHETRAEVRRGLPAV